MKILLIGRNGQVGFELERSLSSLGTVDARDRESLDIYYPDVIRAVVRNSKPDVIVNAAAYNAVDKAESEPEHARAVNAEAPGVMAEEARRSGALLVHYSTDYVFDGVLQRPYAETDAPNPLSAYGRSKLEGEERVRASGCRHVILRTSWVYSRSRANFVTAMLAKAKEREKLRVVADQTGVPTWAADVAALTRAILVRRDVPEGTWHASASGEVTRHAFAVEALRLAGSSAEVTPIATAEFPAAALRPAYSVLDSRALPTASGIEAIGFWRDRLRTFFGVRP